MLRGAGVPLGSRMRNGSRREAVFLAAFIAMTVLLAGCAQEDQPAPSRYDRIPATAVKMTPVTDQNPPKSLSPEYLDPVPIAIIDTAGAEDSAFILPDGDTLYRFFTPDVTVPPERQVLDGVTGIWISRKTGGAWSEPERVVLQDKGKLAIDGCEFVQGDTMWFCSAREGYTGVNWFTAEFKDGRWRDWRPAGFPPEYEVGELHIAGDELYYHSSRDGGAGGLDIWVSRKADGAWSEPENVAAINTPSDEGWPFMKPDGSELWFSRDYGLWRSRRVDGEWAAPERMIFPLAGEAALDAAGNVYFTHHYFDGDRMIEADIYFAERVERH